MTLSFKLFSIRMQINNILFLNKTNTYKFLFSSVLFILRMSRNCFKFGQKKKVNFDFLHLVQKREISDCYEVF